MALSDVLLKHGRALDWTASAQLLGFAVFLSAGFDEGCTGDADFMDCAAAHAGARNQRYLRLVECRIPKLAV